jgi:phosphoglycolate phosphatase-like HAD superfamily hydrolase
MSTAYLNPRSIDACLVDLDGTLVHTLGDFVAALNHMLADVQLPPGSPRVVTQGAVESWVGKGSEHLIACALNWSLTSLRWALMAASQCKGRAGAEPSLYKWNSGRATG